MRAWSLHGLQCCAVAKPLLPPTSFAPAALLQPAIQRRHRATYLQEQHERPGNVPTILTPGPIQRQPHDSRRYPVFEKLNVPNGDARDWAALLEGALPPHLREWSGTDSPVTLNTFEATQVLQAAREQHAERGSPVDLLYHLAFERGRWSAVVWLIKQLVEKTPPRQFPRAGSPAVDGHWANVRSLDTFTEHRKGAFLTRDTHELERRGTRSLDEWTANAGFHEAPDALGQIWQTLGAMVKACAGGEIRPEVLEIIAFLHHEEVMPMSIYQLDPHPDESAVQQPPLLSLLSSRILTSLSDAAWRAHEKVVLEEAKALGVSHITARPEMPGTAYTVNVAGLRPEVWMELILWSCLHGGWLHHGAEILRSVVADKSWKPISWKEYERTIPKEDRTTSSSWRDWEYVFKVRSPSTRDAPIGPRFRVEQTISAEVVIAYIDALTCDASVGVGSRGIGAMDLVERLRALKSFLVYRNRGTPLALSTGTWDGLVLRLSENPGFHPERDPGTLHGLIRLSPGFGQGVRDVNTQDLPDYVLDGNMALQGLLHRALHAQIRAGSVEGALAVFTWLQDRADYDQMKSITDLAQSTRSMVKNNLQRALFTSNMSGIDYPAFEMQIPPHTLGAFLASLVEAKAWRLARWLLFDTSVGGPVIGRELYNNSSVQPAVVRAAVEMNHSSLLAKIRKLPLVPDTYLAVLDIQVNGMKWEAASRVLSHILDMPGRNLRAENLANLVRVMLGLVPESSKGNKTVPHHLQQAKRLFDSMWRHRRVGESKESREEKKNVLAVLCAIRPEWAEFARVYNTGARHQNFKLKAKSFDMILEGTVTAYGSAAGRHLLDVFWPPGVRFAFDATSNATEDKTARVRMPRYRPDSLASISGQRITIALPRQSRPLVVYGGLIPSTESILIVLRRALEEVWVAEHQRLTSEDSVDQAAFQPKPETSETNSTGKNPQEIIEWAIRRLAGMPYVATEIIKILDEELSERGMYEVRQKLPEILQTIEDEESEQISAMEATFTNA